MLEPSLLENYCLLGDLEAQIETFVDHYNLADIMGPSTT